MIQSRYSYTSLIIIIKTVVVVSFVLCFVSVGSANIDILHMGEPYPVVVGTGSYIVVPGSVCVDDINKDGFGEIVVEMYNRLILYNHSGSILWSVPLSNGHMMPPRMPSPVAGNIAGDSKLEIVFGDKYSKKLYAWNSNGTLVSGFPKILGGSIFSTPALVDIDGDDYLEIAIGCDGNLVYLVDGNGIDIPGWPVYVGGMVRSQPSFGDIDNDGEYEIIVNSWDQKVYAFNRNGSTVPGWPQSISQFGVSLIYSSPDVGDIDNDGIDEVVVATAIQGKISGGKVIAFDGNGSVLWTAPTCLNAYCSPVIGNIDSDPAMEVVTGDVFKVYAFEHDGSLKWKSVNGDNEVYSAPYLIDVTGDGIQEVFASKKNGGIYGWYGNGTCFMEEYAGGNNIRGSPTVYDIDADGVQELIIGVGSGYINAWKIFNDSNYDIYLLMMDKTPPNISVEGVSDGASYNVNVTPVIEIIEDNPNIQSITLNGFSYTSGTAISDEGFYTLIATAEDKMGNNASMTVNFTIDKTLPQINANIITSQNTNGWYNGEVVVQFNAFDELSGIDSVIPAITLSSEGASQSVTGNATDLAGNTAIFVVSGINIDMTPPVITGAPAISPNAHGWYNSEVVVQFNASDELSGIDSATPAITISSEGTSQSVTGTATDLAGNTATFTVSGINIDMTPPVININSPINYGIYTMDLKLNVSAEDQLSGVSVTYFMLNDTYLGLQALIYNPLSYQFEPGIYILEVKSIDEAGNVGEYGPISFVVYNPEAGIAKGNGWVYPNAESTLSSEASFHFNSMYDDSGNPVGTLKLSFKNSNISLQSSTFDWVVIKRTNVRLQGTGMINGEGMYTFQMVSEIGDKYTTGNDYFGITVWKGADIEAEPYLVAGSVMKSGNIIIHSN